MMKVTQTKSQRREADWLLELYGRRTESTRVTPIEVQTGLGETRLTLWDHGGYVYRQWLIGRRGRVQRIDGTDQQCDGDWAWVEQGRQIAEETK